MVVDEKGEGEGVVDSMMGVLAFKGIAVVSFKSFVFCLSDCLSFRG